MSEGSAENRRDGCGESLPHEQMLTAVYQELRKLAAARLVQEAAGHTLQPTALVHEAWLRLSSAGGDAWQDQTHFYRAAAQAMRHILIDHARRKASLKRAGGWKRMDIAELDVAAVSPNERVLLIDDSLQRLEKEDPESAEVVMLKFFTGLSNKEAARTLGVSEATIERRWSFAKVLLFQMIRESESAPDRWMPQ